jgi:hypothetical protein
MKRWLVTLLTIVTFLISNKVSGQILSYTFIDPCTQEVTIFTIPAQGTVVFFLNKSRSFTSADVANGTLAAWVNQVYAEYRMTAPCGQQQGQVTQNQITTQIISSTVQSVVGSIMSSAQSASAGMNVNSSSSGNNNKSGNHNNNSNSNGGGNTNSNTSNSSAGGGSSSTASSGGSGSNSGGSTGNGGSGSTGSSGGSGGSSGGSGGGNTGGGSGGSSGGSGGGNTGGGSGGSTGGGSTGGGTTGGGTQTGGTTGNTETGGQQKAEEVAATTTMNVDAHNGGGGESSGESGGSGGGGKGGGKSGSKSSNSNPMLVQSDLTTAQNLDKSFTPILNLGISQSSVTGASSWGLTSMTWLNFRQFALSGRYTSMIFNKTGSIKYISNFNVTGVYSYGNILGFIGYSGILNAGKYGVTGFNASVAGTLISEDKSSFFSPSITAFYTRPFAAGKRLTISPELYIISTPLIYSSKEQVFQTDRTFSGFIGSGFDYQISKRFKFNINYKANLSTNPEFPILSFFLIGSKVNL